VVEDQLGPGQRARPLEDGHEGLGHRDEVPVTALSGLVVVGAGDVDGPLLEVEVRLAQPEELALAHARSDRDREQVAPLRGDGGEHHGDLRLAEGHVGPARDLLALHRGHQAPPQFELYA